MGKLSLSASTASPGHSSNPGALSEITAWEGGDPQTGIHSMWQFSPRQQQPKSKTQPPRSFNPKFIRSNGSTVAEEVDEDEDGEDEDEEGDAGGAAPDPTNRGTGCSYAHSTVPANIAKTLKAIVAAKIQRRTLSDLGYVMPESQSIHISSSVTGCRNFVHSSAYIKIDCDHWRTTTI